MPEELKSCPACEKNNGVCIARTTSVVTYAVYCHNKNCETRGPKRLTQEEAFAAWNALPRSPHITPNDADCKGCPERRPLVWRKELPTLPGWYWWCYDRDTFSHMVYVVQESTLRKTDNDRFLMLYPNCMDKEFPVSERGGEWAGPIPMPEEPVS